MELVRDNIGEIIKKHLEFKLSLKTSVHIAVEIGEMLNEQKEILPQGSFTSWVDENLPFTIRTAQNYMKLFEKRDIIELADPDSITEAYLLLKPKPVASEDKDDIYDDVIDIDIDDEIADAVPRNESIKDYWDHLGPLISQMDAVYMRLSRMRNSTTPIAVGSMIGNIKDMANVLITWSPDSLKICPTCKGGGCEECGGRLVGLWKRSEN